MAAGEGYEEFEGRRFWSDEWIKSLMELGRFPHILLFEWVWTGPMRTPSGLVHCPLDALRSIGHFTKLPPKRFREMVDEATEQPSSGLAWFPSQEYWWVKNYIVHRRDHANKLVASARDLLNHPRELASLVISYNSERNVDLARLDVIVQFSAQNGIFPYSTDTLRERYTIDTATYLKPYASPEAVPASVSRKPQLRATPEAPPGWNECRKAYHDGFLKVTGEKPIMDVVDFARLKALLTKAKTDQEDWGKLATIISFAVSGKDPGFPLDQGLPSLQTICSKHHINRIKSILATRGNR